MILHGLKREALAYCEEIGQTLMRQANFTHVQLVDLQLFILVKIFQRKLFDFRSKRFFRLRSRKNREFLIEIFKLIQRRTKNRRG